MTVVIFGSTQNRAFVKWKDILDNMKFGEVDRVNTRGGVFVLKNGDIYKVVTGNEGARGYKFEYAYIDKFISIDIMNTIIIPDLQRNKASFEFY